MGCNSPIWASDYNRLLVWWVESIKFDQGAESFGLLGRCFVRLYLSLSVQYLELGIDQLFVRQAQQLGKFIHQIVFMLVHLAVHVNDPP